MTKAFVYALKVPHTIWRAAIEMLKLALNNSNIKSLGDQFPLTIFTRYLRDSSGISIVTKIEGASKKQPISEGKLNTVVNLSSFSIHITVTPKRAENADMKRKNTDTTYY